MPGPNHFNRRTMTTVARPVTDPGLSEGAAVTIRPVETRAEYEACVELQRDTWGRSFSDIVPVSMMGIAVKMGGICLGAFASGGAMLGFVFGVTGPRDDELAHWSHMLAVRDEARNAGIGRRLKLAQREALSEKGVDTVYWTFDPLVARNAHFNLNRLGATIAEFVPDMYGHSDSDLHCLGTDRLIARWSIKEDVAGDAWECDGSAGTGLPCMGGPGCNGSLPPGADVIEVPVPLDIDRVVAESLEEALAWRRGNNAAFSRLFSEGYDIVGFSVGEEHGRYILQNRTGASVTDGHGV